jgi:hypothetical protein
MYGEGKYLAVVHVKRVFNAKLNTLRNESSRKKPRQGYLILPSVLSRA